MTNPAPEACQVAVPAVARGSSKTGGTARIPEPGCLFERFAVPAVPPNLRMCARAGARARDVYGSRARMREGAVGATAATAKRRKDSRYKNIGAGRTLVRGTASNRRNRKGEEASS